MNAHPLSMGEGTELDDSPELPRVCGDSVSWHDGIETGRRALHGLLEGSEFSWHVCSWDAGECPNADLVVHQAGKPRISVANLPCRVGLRNVKSAVDDAVPLTVSVHVSGGARFDRLERFPADLHDTGCTLIRGYAPPGKPHTYSYTVTINEAGRHVSRDTFFLTVDPYRRGQTVYNLLALALPRRPSGMDGTRVRNMSLDHMFVEDAYIYRLS